MDDAEIRKKVIDLLKKKFNLAENPAFSQNFLFSDLGISSFDALDSILDIEKAFNCTIPDNEMVLIRTIDELVLTIKKHTKHLNG